VDSKNGDMEKIIATIIAIIDIFLSINPTSTIYLSGSNSKRTRLYQIAISKYYDEFSLFYAISGSINDNYEPFKKSINYESFLIKKLFNN
jgi:hypothetical protein